MYLTYSNIHNLSLVDITILTVLSTYIEYAYDTCVPSQLRLILRISSTMAPKIEKNNGVIVSSIMCSSSSQLHSDFACTVLHYVE